MQIRKAIGVFIIGALLAISSSAEAWRSGKAGHNGGLSQINLGSLQVGNEYPFLNLLKTAQAWVYNDFSGAATPADLDSNGYPLAGSNGFSHGGYTTVFYVPEQAVRPSRYVFKWDGNGTIVLGMNNSAGQGSLTSTTGSGRYEFSTTDSRFAFTITAAGTPAITNLRVVAKADEAALDAGQVFGTQFKQRLIQGRFGVIRFINWQIYNIPNNTDWASRKPLGYVFYSGAECRNSIYGVTTSSGDDYSATIGTGAPVDKTAVIVKFNSSATTSSPTFNLNGTGAIPIARASGNTTISAGSNNRPVANTLGYMVYDAALNAWIKYGGDADPGNTCLSNGVPPELMVQLAAEVGAHPWFQTPQMAADPATDYMTSLAAYIRDYGPPWMIPRFEGVNELWNYAFPTTTYAENKSFAYWGATDYHQWYGKAVSVLGQGISAVYSNDRTKYQVIAGVQTTTYTGTSASNPRLTAANYVAQAAPPQTGYTKSAAYNWVTHVAVANYFSPTDYSTLAELRNGFDYYVTYANNGTQQQTIAANYAATLLGATAPYNLNFFQAAATAWYAWAQNNWGGSIKLKMNAYEGGYSPDYYPDAWTSAITGATKANPVVLTLATTTNAKGTISGNAAVIGMQLSISGVTGMTELNGNTYTVSAVSGNSVSINVDGSGFGSYVSGGTATYVNAPTYTNTLRYASKWVLAMQTYYATNYSDFVAAGGEFPSQYMFGAPTNGPDGTRTIASAIQVWGLFDPSVYNPPMPGWNAIQKFNGVP